MIEMDYYSNMLDAIDKLIIAGTSSLPSITQSIIYQTTSSMLTDLPPQTLWKIKKYHLRIEVLQLHTYACVEKSKNIMSELKFYDFTHMLVLENKRISCQNLSFMTQT